MADRAGLIAVQALAAWIFLALAWPWAVTIWSAFPSYLFTPSARFAFQAAPVGMVLSALLFLACGRRSRLALPCAFALFLIAAAALADAVLRFDLAVFGYALNAGVERYLVSRTTLTLWTLLLGAALFLLVGAHNRGDLVQGPAAPLLRRIEPSHRIDTPDIVAWALTVVATLMALGPWADTVRHQVPFLWNVVLGREGPGFFGFSSSTLLFIAFAVAIWARATAAVWIGAILFLSASSGRLVTLDLWPGPPTSWRGFIQSPAVLGPQILATIYLLGAGRLGQRPTRTPLATGPATRSAT